MDFEEKVVLADYTWWKVGGLADYFCLPKSVEEIKEALLWANQRNSPVTLLGGGSNVLISDDGIEGLVICTKNLTGVTIRETQDRMVVEALAGTLKAEVLKPFLKAKLAPALFLCGLPGDVAGGVVMNAGVSEQIVPREFVEIVDWFEVVSLVGGQPEVKRFENKDITWTYRHTEGWQPGVISKVQVSWPLEVDEEIPKKVKMATRTRISKQPLNMPSCGSVFKNPEGNSSGALIEKAGLKGYTVGGARVSEKHANFIVNNGGAKAKDIRAIIDHIQSTIKSQFNIDLKTEVRPLGRWNF